MTERDRQRDRKRDRKRDRQREKDKETDRETDHLSSMQLLKKSNSPRMIMTEKVKKIYDPAIIKVIYNIYRQT